MKVIATRDFLNNRAVGLTVDPTHYHPDIYDGIPKETLDKIVPMGAVFSIGTEKVPELDPKTGRTFTVVKELRQKDMNDNDSDFLAKLYNSKVIIPAENPDGTPTEDAKDVQKEVEAKAARARRIKGAAAPSLEALAAQGAAYQVALKSYQAKQGIGPADPKVQTEPPKK